MATSTFDPLPSVVTAGDKEITPEESFYDLFELCLTKLSLFRVD